MAGYEEIEGAGAPITAWVKRVPVEHEEQNQQRNVDSRAFIHSNIAVMPAVHYGVGAPSVTCVPTHERIHDAHAGVRQHS